MTATLVRANCKLLSIGNSDSVPLVALLAKNLLIHYYFVIRQINLAELIFLYSF